MPESSDRSISARTVSHSDVADTAAMRRHVTEVTEAQFGKQLLAALRAHPRGVRVTHFREEWVKTGEGLIYEITASVSPAE